MYNNRIGRCYFVSLVVISSLVASSISWSFNSSIAEEVKKLISKNMAREAYSLLCKDIGSLGEESYDMLLGDLARSINKTDEAILAYERVTISNPQNIEAKIHLANAYYNLNAYAKAMETILTIKNPGKYNFELQRLFNKVDRKLFHLNRTWRIHGKLMTGFNNNVESAVSGDYAEILMLTDNSMKPEWLKDSFNSNSTNSTNLEEYANEYYNIYRQLNRKIESFYISPLLGIGGHHRLNDHGGNWYWNSNLQHQLYLDTRQGAFSKANINIGFNQTLNGPYLVDGAFYYQEYIYQGKRYTNSPIIFMGFSKLLDNKNIVRLYLEEGIFNYNKDKEFNAYSHVWGAEWKYLGSKNTLHLRGFLGRQQPNFASHAKKYNGHNYYGTKIIGKHRLTNEVTLGATFAYQNHLFDEKHEVYEYGERRRDYVYEALAYLSYQLNANFSWYIECSYTDNHSNLLPYKYNHIDILTGIDFKF